MTIRLAATALALAAMAYVSVVPDALAGALRLGHRTTVASHGPQRRLRIALALRGVAYDELVASKGSIMKVEAVDYRRVLPAFRSRVLEPLQGLGDVDTYFATYHSKLDDQLIADFRPHNYSFVGKSYRDFPNQWWCVLHAIDLIRNELARGIHYDYVMILRFDLFIKQNITAAFKINTDHFQFLWRETGAKANDKEGHWRDHRRVSDSMYGLNPRYLDTLRAAITNTKYPHGHYFYWDIVTALGGCDDVSFLFPGDPWDSNPTLMPNPVYELIRNLKPGQENT